MFYIRHINTIIYIIGVSGCGKSTIGKLLSTHIDMPFFDGDDYHPQTNISKMKSGKPLTDDDRKEWLITLNKLATDQLNLKGAVIACSALKEVYRNILSHEISNSVKWVFLKGSKDLIMNRIKKREAHFMPTSLLQSQFDSLEIPEYGIHISIEEDPKAIIEIIQKQLHL